MIPTRRLALVAVGASVALWWFPGALPGGIWGGPAAVNAALACIAVLDAALAVRPATITVVRRHPPVVVLGHTATLAWHVRNPGDRRVRVALADELQPSLHAEVDRVDLTVDGRAQAVATTSFTPSRRGRFALGGVVVRTTGPLGLAHRQATRQVPGILRVHPPFRSKAEAELRIRRARMLDVGLRSARGIGSGTEFEAIREYGPDDEFRRIDWAATARTGRPIVRTYRPEQNQTILVLVDNGRLAASRVAEVPRIEHLMDAAVMLTAVASRLGDKVGLVTFDQAVRSVLAPARRTDQVMAATEAMYDLQPVLAESDYRGVVDHVLSRFRRRSLLVLLTDLQAEAWEQSLLPVVPQILRRHLLVVGAVRDPRVEAWTERAEGEDGAYRSVSAIRAVDERTAVARRLQAMGATVIDAVPGRLAGSLTDAYLHVKSSGRL